MKRLSRLIVFIVLVLAQIDVSCQERYPMTYFRSPIDFPIRISGSFGEVRRNHIHSGIDIRTEGVEGKPVYAVADGYVSRIFISPGGFGKALYVTHPNGYTTVYGHLRGFNSAIGSWIRAKQYRDESFDQDVSVEPGVLKVKKGEIMAYSGNSGMSGGPHLHFEFRETSSQEIIDPMLFGLPFHDNKPPRIYSIRIYPVDGKGLVNASDKAVTLPVKGVNGKYFVSSRDTVYVSGEVFFAIEAFDFVDDSDIKCGVSSIVLSMDTSIVFMQNLEKFAFSETRYVNTILDYPAVVDHQQRFQRSYIAPNNKLRIYSHVVNRGVINFTDSRIHRMIYKVKDVFGNSSVLEFPVLSRPPGSWKDRKPKPPSGRVMLCKTANHFTLDGLVLDLPADALYEDLDFTTSTTKALPTSFCPVYHLQDEETPLHTYCDLAIKPENMPSKMASKAVIVRVSGSNHPSSVGGKMENGVIKTRIRDFGNYTVMADTVRPVIHPSNLAKGKKAAGQLIRVKISDNLSGIKSYRGTLNGKWILMDYDGKSGMLTYTIDDQMKPGKNEFRLVVRDAVGNEAVYSTSLIR